MDDDLIVAGIPARKWAGRLVKVRIGPNAFMRLREDEARAMGLTPVDVENKMRTPEQSENKRRRGRPRKSG